MKKLRFIILLSVLQLNVNAQAYFPLPDSNAVWTISMFAQGSIKSIYKYGVFGDTVFNNILYKKVYENSDYNFNLSNSYLRTFIRESNKKIYRINPNTQTESIIYDFNLVISDTAKSINSIGTLITKTVITLDSILVNGQFHKRWGFVGNEYWIEGIGSSFGLLNSLWQGWDLCFSLVCLSEPGIITYQNFTPDCTTPLPYDCDNNSILTSTSEHSLENNKSIIFPNPFSSSAIIKTSIELNDATLKVYDMLGQEVLENTHLNGQEIKIMKGNLNSGNYYYHLSQNSSLISKGKFIIE